LKECPYNDLDSGNYSYQKTFQKYLSTVIPKQVLEWGPGYSTYMLASLCPDVKIYSIEHDLNWLSITKERLQPFNKRVEIIHKNVNAPACQYATYGYNLFDKCGPFDLIFIDGRRRVECCMVALDIISSDGIMILHDAERKSYRRVIDKYINVINEQDRTIVFTKKS
jgi:predicted O-methyltransferase YrrM